MDKCMPKMLDIGCNINQKQVQCNISEYGGIGRPSGLKIRRVMRAGSTPATRTIFIL